MTNLKSKLLILTTLALLVSGLSVTHANSHGSYNNHSYTKKPVYSNNSSHSSQNKWKKASYNSKSSYAQNKVRSRSDVMSEVKQRYNAKVLKISLNEKAGVYNVRMLMPSGKVRSIKVSAR